MSSSFGALPAVRQRGTRGGSTRHGRKVRAMVLDRDGHRCRLQLEGCEVRATHAHHTLGWVHGDDPERMVAACESCNLKVGDPNRIDPQPLPRTSW